MINLCMNGILMGIKLNIIEMSELTYNFRFCLDKISGWINKNRIDG